METEPEFDKRIVVEHVTGPRKGLSEIIGTLSQAAKEGHPTLPTFIPELWCGLNAMTCIPASIIKVDARRVIYRECAGPPLHKFDEFHESQV